MDTFVRDLRHAVRSLRRTPGFTIAALLILDANIAAGQAARQLLAAPAALVFGWWHRRAISAGTPRQ